MKLLKIALPAAALLALPLFVGYSADAASPRPHRPDVMSAPPQTLNATWVEGTSQDGGAKGQSIAMTDFAFYSFPMWWDQNLSDVKKVRASWLLHGTNSGGSPRFSLELDANGDGVFVEPTGNPADKDVNVFLDPASCSDFAASGGGWVESDFTGEKTNCVINDSSGGTYTSDADGTAWSKLVTAYPAAKVWFMFLIQDATIGTNYVDRIMLDSAFFTKQP